MAQRLDVHLDLLRPHVAASRRIMLFFPHELWRAESFSS